MCLRLFFLVLEEDAVGVQLEEQVREVYDQKDNGDLAQRTCSVTVGTKG